MTEGAKIVILALIVALGTLYAFYAGVAYARRKDDDIFDQFRHSQVEDMKKIEKLEQALKERTAQSLDWHSAAKVERDANTALQEEVAALNKELSMIKKERRK